ncbi:MAG: peptidoglycan DD-metalloendopeptidase family protein [Planctomycetia bacterium]|nr:peptidoglycan DD-metalloendopeptidase family protein [Planctomycetia bacterium]
MNIRFTIIILIIISGFASSQNSFIDIDVQLQEQDKIINALKREVAKTRQDIKNQQNKAQSTAKRITSLEKEMSLTSQLINKLTRVERYTKNQINKLEQIIPENERLLETFLNRYEKRAIEIYKKGSPTSLVKLLSSSSWRQAVYRVRYMKIVSDIEKTMQDSVQSLLVDITNQKSELNHILKKNKSAKNEKAKQQALLIKTKKITQNELKNIQNNKKELEKYLAEKQEGLKQLETVRQKLLNDKNKELREKRIREQQEYLKTKQFAELKGHLLWPIEGKVVTKFGSQWNAKLKTTTDSPGIDIEGTSRAPVRAVLNGIVTTITFIRGYGTTIIIDHGGGFYTVYTHVTDLQIHEDGEVKSRDIIAYTGEASAVSGSKLHFEIWGNQQKLDPEQWLVK